MSNKLVSFGDNVRIRATPITEAAGLAGLSGQIYGHTTPSVTGVEVMGEIKDDLAFNVFFKERNQDFWFAPELLEFLDHAPGTEMKLRGIPKKWVRKPNGEWETLAVAEQPNSQDVSEMTADRLSDKITQLSSLQEASRPKQKAWWKFWE